MVSTGFQYSVGRVLYSVLCWTPSYPNVMPNKRMRVRFGTEYLVSLLLVFKNTFLF